MLRTEAEMEEEASECGSGCESGWTMYLEQSREISAPPSHEGDLPDEEEEEEEDLSMVSDASSGPPHLQEEEDDFYPGPGEKIACFASASSTASTAVALQNRIGKRRRLETERQNKQQQVASICLDDTASSPFFGFSTNVRRLLLQQQNCKPVVSSPTSFGIPSNNVCSRSNGMVFVQEAMEFSYDFSATYLKGKPALQKPIHYMNPTSAKPVCGSEAGKKLW